MTKRKEAAGLHQRLKKIIGQVQAVDRMVDTEMPCEDIISQINAAKAALHKVGQVMLETHIHRCVADGIKKGNAEETVSRFSKAVDRFSRMV